MKDLLTISSKGQITLPAAIRQALGLQGNAVLTAEAKDGRIVLSPAMVIETEMWTEAAVAAWDAADEFAAGEREALQEAVARGSGRA